MKGLLAIVVSLVLASPAFAIDSAAFYVAGHSPASFDVSRSPPMPRLADVVPDNGGRWTYPGEIRSHLLASHGYTSEQLAGMTQGQLRSLHDASHEGTATQFVSLPGVQRVQAIRAWKQEGIEERGGIHLFQRRPVRGMFGRCVGGNCGG